VEQFAVPLQAARLLGRGTVEQSEAEHDAVPEAKEVLQRSQVICHPDPEHKSSRRRQLETGD
jgi:hypothetical protein